MLGGMILETMLQRLFASLVNGPSMNARPHRSRQRCDWMDLASFASLEPAGALKTLLENRRVEFPAKVPVFEAPDYPESEWSEEQKTAREAHTKQTRQLKKLREIADDALEYANDHGESCLALGFPLLSLPPAGEEKIGRAGSRILAPLLLLPIQIQVRSASRAGVTIECVGEGADLLVANPSLLAWLERQTGKNLGDVFLDEEAADPWREVDELYRKVTGLLGLESPLPFGKDTLLESVPVIEKLPKKPVALPSAVLGLFPLSNQSLLRDTRWMLENEKELREPVSAFLSPEALHDPGDSPGEGETAVAVTARDFSSEWLVSNADPCQANAVLASREAKALVVHGPPGTGKSQTITNMIADHLARGERILFVCDKRTALDVVKYRLDAVGLGHLCGVVHDPSADRRDFYMGLRTQLENLADAAPVEDPRPVLERINKELSATHAELEGCRQKLHGPGTGVLSFHELLGNWLELSAHPGQGRLAPLPGLTLDEVEGSATALDEIFRRADRAAYGANPFRNRLGIALSAFLARSGPDWETLLKGLEEAGGRIEAARPGEKAAPLAPDRPLESQAALRDKAADRLTRLAGAPEPAFVQAAAGLSDSRRRELQASLGEAESWLAQARPAPLDRMLLSSAASGGLLSLVVVNQHLAALTEWETKADSFFKRLFAGSAKQAATSALAPLGLALASGWRQGLDFYRGLKPRLLVADWLARAGAPGGYGLSDDEEMASRLAQARLVWETMAALSEAGLQEPLGAILVAAGRPRSLSASLAAEAGWAREMEALRSAVAGSGLFAPEVPDHCVAGWLAGQSAADQARGWRDRRETLEDMVRLKQGLDHLPEPLRGATDSLAAEGADLETALALFRCRAIENELRARLRDDPDLAVIDGERIEAAFDRFGSLAQEKQRLVGTYIRFFWLSHQKARLLATTGTQLNRAGASLRQRLYVRGKKALKLRQMLATGAENEGGDPLYDLCPVWMASPSTVAQVFPRHAIFDVVIFDEASQCRLEEALPVLLRGHRVVIAGDQKQLPPTRFFESALADSGDSDAETAEELFYQQQQEAEDLLTAALNLDVREAYLDVHYRSRNEALIGFSNEHYYGSRLQPIPGHPRNKALSTPIRLHAVNGLYAERANVKEAEAAVNLIAELLASDDPPSIGVACFNITQKEAILEALGRRVDLDADFARRYEVAKRRKGRDSFEGLFVKNLENVQGDERDVMIISTTFGPDEQGKFRRNFGALSQREGGRRLNVLVTRARDAVHVLTSIPSVEYRAVQPVPVGQLPNGRLQLYEYLRYAERLELLFESYQDELERMRRDAEPELQRWDSATPSRLAAAIGQTLLETHRVGSHLHWGNEGFCVDVACIHPLMPADVTVGVLADFSRFHKTPDPIEWDIFRTRVLRGQGWELQRLWSPVLFRRVEEMMQRVRAAHDRLSVPPPSATWEAEAASADQEKEEET